MEILFSILLVLLGMGMAIWGGYWLVEGASSLAKSYQISELTIGLSIVALGTSAPEWFVNVVASFHDEGEMVFANVIGSNIFNLFLILGIAGFVFPINVRSRTVWQEVPFSILLLIVLFILLNDELFFDEPISDLDRTDGLILLVFFAVFTVYIFTNLREVTQVLKPTIELPVVNKKKMVGYIVAGIALLAGGSELAVSQTVVLADYFEVSKKLITFLVLAPGTSLPELFTSIVACVRKKYGLAVGNVIGSNVINISLVLATCGIINKVDYDYTLNFDLSFLLFGNIFFWLAMFSGGGKYRLSKVESVVLTLFMAGYIYFLIIRK